MKQADDVMIEQNGIRYRQIVIALLAAVAAVGTARAQVQVDGSVYGGGKMGDVNGSTTVNLTSGTIDGNVYGGARGTEDIAALVRGDTQVNLNASVADTVKGCIVGGSIFGCNNVNGTPLGTATVHIYKTQNQAATRITNPTEGEQTAKVAGRYDLTAVYGGGNAADVTGATNVVIGK